MSDYILVPIHLDALQLDQAQSVAGPLIDFTKLPWSGSKLYKDKPYLSETIASNPSDESHQLQKGLHFHWALPDALTKSMSLPIVNQQAFLNIFGTQTGMDIWNQLVSLKWLLPLSQGNTTAMAAEPAVRIVDASTQENIKQNYQAIQDLLKQSNFPAAPNRWLITRNENGQIKSSTIVESDYLWPTSKQQDEAGQPLADFYTAFPLITNDPTSQPYRYLGRAVPLGTQAAPQTDYLTHPLTAVGYGEPSFAAFYPASRSVFGYCDTQAAGPSAAVTYELIGWYSDPTKDYFPIFVQAYTNKWRKDHQTQGDVGVHAKHQQKNYLYLDLLEAIRQEFQWYVPIQLAAGPLKAIQAGSQNAWDHLLQYKWIDSNGLLQPKTYNPKSLLGVAFRDKEDQIRTYLNDTIKAQLPQQSVYYAQYNYNAIPQGKPDVQLGNVKLAIGNSATEALSALIANELSTSNKENIEDHLEAIQFSSRLQHRQLDIGPKFEAFRHEKQFTATRGGSLWSIQAQNQTNNKADQVSDSQQITLPAELGNTLNELNRLQEILDHTNFAIEATRQQIYADWCWYLKKESNYKEGLNNQGGSGFGNQNQGGFGNQNQGTGGGSFGGGNQGFGGGDQGFGGQGGGFGNQNQGGFGNQNQGNSGDGNSDKGALALEKEFLEALKAFIVWEIEEKLGDLLQQESSLLSQLELKHQTVTNDLLVFQQEAQYLSSNDINDWIGFWTALQQKAGSINAQLNDAISKKDKNKTLLILNQWLDQSGHHLSFPDGKVSAEAHELTIEMEKGALPPGGLQRLNRLALEANFPQIKHRPKYQLETKAADRYWRPNDPVAFISGFDPSIRHGYPDASRADGLQNCKRLPSNTNLNTLNQTTLAGLQAAIQQTKINAASAPAPSDWHPMFLNWDMAFDQVKQSKDDAYGPNYISQYYKLGDTDFIPKQLQYDQQTNFYGRSILTPNGNMLLKKTLAIQLVPELMEQFYKDKQINLQSPNPTLDQFQAWIKQIDAAVSNLPTAEPDFQPLNQITQWLEQELTRLDATDSKIIVRYLQKIESDPDHYILDQFFKEKGGARNIALQLDAFLEWATERTNLKARYFKTQVSDKSTPLDVYLMESEAHRSAFITWLKPKLGTSWDRYCTEQHIAADKKEAYLEENYNAVISWFQPQVRAAMHRVIYVLSYQQLTEIRGLAQAMGGFDQALVMRNQVYQLNITDPFPYDKDDTFAKKVQTAVKNTNRIAPAEYLPFSPIRAGKMNIQNLSLVDNFGRYWPSDEKSALDNLPVLTPTTVTLAGDTTHKEVALAPRFAQSARLDFRWMAANEEVTEMNDHPATNPICGWILPNNLDNSLMVYSQLGHALGYIDELGQWRVFPGNSGPILPADIDNVHLARMVDWLCEQGAQDGFISSFISTLDVAQENMQPESFAQHEGLALLIGQPLALVRTSIKLELKNPLAINISEKNINSDIQNFDKLKSDPAQKDHLVERFKRNTFDFETVQVPLRVGEFRQLNDGLAGYWVETNDHYKNDQFFAPQTTPVSGLPSNIITRQKANDPDSDETKFLLQVALNQGQLIKLAMLVDPRAKIHANCGLLPIREVQIPPDQYREALQNIQIAFLSTPILTSVNAMHLSLPKEPGFQWSWVEIDGQNWTEISTLGILRKHQVEQLFDAQANAIWAMLGQQGWIQLIGYNRAKVIPTDQRSETKLPPAFASLHEQIELLLESTKINPFDPTARFSGPQQIVEGWLKLSPG